MRIADFLHRAGLLLPNRRNAVCLMTDARRIDGIYPAVDEALRQRPGYTLIIVAPYSDLIELRRRFPHEEVLPHPLGSASNSLTVDESFTVESILRLLPEIVPGNSGTKSGPNFLTKLIAGNPISNVDELALRLGRPQNILCLGNGPSSEDLGLKDISYDCLFRVNWTWKQRGLFMAPNVVLTADRELPSGTPKPVIGFPNAALGLPVLRRYCAMLRPPRQGYMFLDTLLPDLDAQRGNLVPSNGAIMIALAAALRPRRMIIAGIDFYEHDEGRYPGDAIAVDGYSRQHSRSTDLAVIQSALAAYDGQVTVIGDNLGAELNYSSPQIFRRGANR